MKALSIRQPWAWLTVGRNGADRWKGAVLRGVKRIIEQAREAQKENGMPNERSDYMHAYYEANKARKKAKRKSQPRTEAAKAAEARYAEKRRILKEIEEMPRGLQAPGVPKE